MKINIEQFSRKMHATCGYLWQKEKMSQNSTFYYFMKMSQNNIFYYFILNMKRIVLSLGKSRGINGKPVTTAA